MIVEAKGDFEEAEALYRRWLAIDRELLGDEHTDVATTTSNLGLLLGSGIILSEEKETAPCLRR